MTLELDLMFTKTGLNTFVLNMSKHVGGEKITNQYSKFQKGHKCNLYKT